MLGSQPANRANIERTLRARRNGYIMSGGIAELFLSHRKADELYLLKRKGFVKLAKDTNAILVPVYVFGHTRLFDQLASGGGLAMFLSRMIQGSITYFWGRYFLPFPYSTPITAAYGAPLEIDWAHSTVDGVHDKFVAAVRTLYEANKHGAGYGDTPLVVA